VPEARLLAVSELYRGAGGEKKKADIIAKAFR
jgi:hypothetical protein